MYLPEYRVLDDLLDVGSGLLSQEMHRGDWLLSRVERPLPQRFHAGFNLERHIEGEGESLVEPDAEYLCFGSRRLERGGSARPGWLGRRPGA